MSAIKIRFHIKGDLTKKQERTKGIIEEIIYAFYNEKQEKQERTWTDLLKITKLPKGTLHKYLVKLMEQSVIKGEVRAYNGRLERFFSYTEEFVEMEGKAPISVKDAFFLPKNKTSRKIYRGYVVTRKARALPPISGRKSRAKYPVENGETEHWRIVERLK